MITAMLTDPSDGGTRAVKAHHIANYLPLPLGDGMRGIAAVCSCSTYGHPAADCDAADANLARHLADVDAVFAQLPPLPAPRPRLSARRTARLARAAAALLGVDDRLDGLDRQLADYAALGDVR